MSTVPVSNPGSVPVGVRALSAQIARWFAGLFEARVPAERASSTAIVVLVGIIAVGAFVRMWGLGAVGLHGDEETMAMPTMHIVEQGDPLLPSGMYYPRAVAQLYLMAASVQIFGESEWAFRLPSVICGVLLIFLAYLIGRRFLTPVWNLAFTAAVALLPEFIIDAQTARMYSFLCASVAGYMLLLFHWERTNRIAYLIAAVAVLIVGMQFHTLAVFGAFMAFFPGLVRGEVNKIVLGGVAFAVIVAGFVGIDHWISTKYPDETEVLSDKGSPGGGGARAAEAIPHIALWVFALAAVGAAAVSTFAVRHVNGRIAAISAAALAALGLLAQVAFHYHVAGLLMVAAAVIAWRTGRLTVQRVLPLVAIVVVLAIAQFLLLRANDVPLRQIVGAMSGAPSIWAYIVITQYSLAATLLVAGGIVVGLWKVAQRGAAPDFVLLAVLGVWIPLLIIGVFAWFMPLRYTAVQAVPLLLVGFAAAQWMFSGRAAGNAKVQAIAAAVVCLLVVNPLTVARTVNSGYETHPDHQGAAKFMLSTSIGPNDILIAEDVLQQTYYLGRVDYWLQSEDVAGSFIRKVDGVWKDFYTNTPLLGNGAQLQALIDRKDRGAIYVIGSGENQEDGRRYFRGPGMAAILESPQFEVVYRGRDDKTTVLKLPAPGAAE